MIKLNEKVRRTLQNYPETRNSDILLTIQVWKTFYPDKLLTKDNINYYIKLESLFELPREDHIKRYRAKFQEAGEFPTTAPEVLQKRRQLQQGWREEMRVHTPPYLEI